MSVPLLQEAMRPRNTTTLPVRPLLALVDSRKTAFAQSTHRRGLHSFTGAFRRLTISPSTSTTVRATLSSLFARTLSSNKDSLLPYQLTIQRYASASPVTATNNNNANKPPLFATTTLYPDDKRVFFFDIDNCLYPKTSGIPHLMKARIEQYFRDSGIPHTEVERLAHRYYVDYGLAIRGLIEKHPDIKVDGGLPLEKLLTPNPDLRTMIESMKVGKKWLFTNAGENHARRVIRILGLEGLFYGMTFCNYLEPQFVCKPDRKSFTKAMREAQVEDPSLCFFADDSAPNIEMAVKMGWTAVHVVEKFKDPTEGEKEKERWFRVESLVELPTVLPQFWEGG
ncbi:hypothetical protein BGX24_009193 [Mortierella sp. AD032]|nr:hypothetical protein BGX24_009193 [Mortierella sp. AD032]